MTTPEYLGPYRIGESLGQGGMGSVYEGVHEKSGERVAVKLIASHVADEPRFRRRFAGEVETLKRLRHKTIVRLIGYGEEKGQLFYSMELVDGESLQQVIRRDKKVDWKRTIDIAVDVCAALKHAHDIGVIHRDLKPANLILTAENSVKLVDFGIAKLFGFGEQTIAGSILGTADYMAPEQADGSGISVRTDLYALGSVMYAMLTGRPPFPGKRVTEVIAALKRDRPIPLDRIDPELPDALVELVHQLLEKDPQDRPPTALSVMNRLKAMRAGLRRQETMQLDALPTEFRSHDASDDDQNTNTAIEENGCSDAALTDSGHLSEKTRPIEEANIAADQSRADSRTEPTVVSRHTEPTVRPEGPIGDDEGPDRIKENEPAEKAKTHFQTVESESTGNRSTTGPPQSVTDHWRHAISIFIMLAVLLAIAIAFYQSTRQPSADDLYQVIEDHRVDESLSLAQTQIDQFLRRFPEDPRFDQVEQISYALDLKRTLRRLSVQAKLGITSLTAAEQGFLDAMTGREQQPVEASDQLRQWLAIYDTDTLHEDEPMQQMIRLARNERQQLTRRAPQILIDPKAEELIARIGETIEKAPAEKTRQVLEGIIELHRDQTWAAPAIEEARRQLDLLVPGSN